MQPTRQCSKYLNHQRGKRLDLFCKILRPALRQDLMMGRTQLVRKVNDTVGAQIVQNIVFY